MLIVIAGFPAAFIGILFTGSLLIEVIFSLDGLGLLGFEAVIDRDYPIMFGTLFVFGLMGLIMLRGWNAGGGMAGLTAHAEAAHRLHLEEDDRGVVDRVEERGEQ